MGLINTHYMPIDNFQTIKTKKEWKRCRNDRKRKFYDTFAYIKGLRIFK